MTERTRSHPLARVLTFAAPVLALVAFAAPYVAH